MYRLVIAKLSFFVLLLFMSSTVGYAFNRLLPDRILMRDGTEYQGLIIKNDAREIILQEEMKERVIPKAAIQRIDDADKTMVYFADLVDPNKAPSWRMMVQDLRSNDAIKSFVQTPPARITEGYLKKVPYLSFHINKYGEMNIYGNPQDPACVEFGAYLKGERLKRFQELARQFFAGYISARSGIATLYHLNLNGDEKKSGKFFFKIIPASSPEARGGWRLSVYDPARLAHARIRTAEYQKITLPKEEILTRHGLLRRDREIAHRSFLNTSLMHWLGRLPGFHGFYRDQEDEFKWIPALSH